MMDSGSVLSAVALIYLTAWFGFVFHAVTRWRWAGRIGTWTWTLAVLVNTAGLVLRWVESRRMGHPYVPVSNQYETMALFALAIGVLYLLLEIRFRVRNVGVFVGPLPFLFLGLASLLFHSEVRPLVPALQSNWLTAHVLTCFLGYAAFALSFGVSVLYLFVSRYGKGLQEVFPDVKTLDEINYKAIALGFPFLSVGIITGAIWANEAWGTYWSWDPKETWSLITWLVYAAFLHARFARGWAGKRTAVLSIVGFLATLFTYFGVNFFLPGLHSYA